MLLEQIQMVRNYRWHLTFAFGLLEPLLRPSKPWSPPSKIHTKEPTVLVWFIPVEYAALISKLWVAGMYLWWTSWVPPPGPECLCRSSQRPKQFYLLYLILKFFHLRGFNATMIY